MNIRQIPLQTIRLDGETQSRVALDADTVTDYSDSLLRGQIFPPLTVFFDGSDYWLVDGFHRHAAALKANLTEFPCEVRAGTLGEAQWCSYSANATNGLRRSNADKRKAIKSALLHPNGAEKSDRQIADELNVSPHTVKSCRDELIATGRMRSSGTRRGADNKVRKLPSRNEKRSCCVCGGEWESDGEGERFCERCHADCLDDMKSICDSIVKELHAEVLEMEYPEPAQARIEVTTRRAGIVVAARVHLFGEISIQVSCENRDHQPAAQQKVEQALNARGWFLGPYGDYELVEQPDMWASHVDKPAWEYWADDHYRLEYFDARGEFPDRYDMSFWNPVDVVIANAREYRGVHGVYPPFTLEHLPKLFVKLDATLQSDSREAA